ncbi:hypothetical protein HF086_010824 [Spodoptera exigua]|uniref:Uncharacterized protein n=1 Tax=Spodoptera exigua TaxID=7107 RepID=A0A922SCH2_SPOEX|nr:hypothetical protein HF086_010824 [Spodoptera exigua]
MININDRNDVFVVIIPLFQNENELKSIVIVDDDDVTHMRILLAYTLKLTLRVFNNSNSVKDGYFHQGESRREGSTDEPTAPDGDVDTSDANTKEPDKDNNWRSPATGGGRGVNRAESCRERDAPRRGKHRNASDPNRLTAHNNQYVLIF